MVTKIYSFDVFETCLVRVWAKPTDLFWELGEQLRQQKLIEISADSWQQMRIKAESQARDASKTGEVSVEQIYQQLARLLGWSTTQTEQAMDKEIALELASLRPVPAIQKRIQALQQANERLIYMSDMYLSEKRLGLSLKKIMSGHRVAVCMSHPK
jgi:predicted HAD superfamily hydrolase